MSGLIEPFTACYVLALAALARLWWIDRGRRARLLPLTLAFAALSIVSLPAVGFLALGSLEWAFPPGERGPIGEEAIVVLAGGFTPPDGIRSRPELDQTTYGRCLHAIELYHQGGRRTVLVSGGKVSPDDEGPACAGVMREFLVRSGVAESDVVEEGESRTTYENAARCAEILRGRRVDRIVLVTSASHMRRAWLAFLKQGIHARPSPCQHRATRFDWSPRDFLPGSGGARAFHQAFHEWVGLAWYWIRGRI